ncbi:MAG: hypothetical protein GXO73_03080 [Calditrichaeota bacterium]|nr:hypothetical protein [Calditrichota bacterium]
MPETEPWWNHPLRMVRHDFLDDFAWWNTADLRKAAREKRRVWHANVEWIHATPGSWPGNAHLVTFDSDRFQKVPGLKIDLLRSYVPAAHAEGLRVVAYVNAHWYSHDFADQHPDWEQRLANGRAYGRVHPLYGSGTTFCPNSGWRDWFFELLREIASTGVDGVFLDGPAIYPGCCYCDACRAIYRERYSADLPGEEDWQDPEWRRFIRFRNGTTAEFLRDASEAVHGVRPDVLVFMNSGGWHASEWRVGRDPVQLARHQPLSGAEAFFHPARWDKSPWDGFLMAKVQLATERPAVVFYHHAIGAWHYEPLPQGEAVVSAVQAGAAGAGAWFGVFDPAVRPNPEHAVGPISRAFGLLEEAEPVIDGSRSLARVAVVHSAATSQFYLSQLEDLYRDPATGIEIGLLSTSGERREKDWRKRKRWCEGWLDEEFSGTCLALGNEHVPFDVLLTGISESWSLDRYAVVVLPNVACLSDSEQEKLLDFVRRGGSLVMSFESGRYDAEGQLRPEWRLGQAAGLTGEVEAWRPRGYEEYVEVAADGVLQSFRAGQLVPRPVYALKVETGSGLQVPVWFQKEIGHHYRAPQGRSAFPAVTVRTYGEGRIVYLAGLFGAMARRFAMPVHDRLLADLVLLASEKASPILTDAPRGVWIEPRQSSDGRKIILAIASRIGEPTRPAEDLVPFGPFRVRLPGRRIRNAKALISDTSLAYGNEEEGAVILVELHTPGEWVVAELE